MSSLEVDTALAKTGDALLRSLTALSEDQWFDRKSGRINARDLSRPLVAFANAEGGTIVIGLRDGHADGVSDELENAVRQAPIDFTVPPVRARVECRTINNAKILIVRVEPSENVHTNKAGECFLRIRDESRRLSLAEHQELIYDRGSRPFEATPVDLCVEDLSPDCTEEYRQAIGSSSVREMLAARDLIDRRGNLTVAAVLLFDDHPQHDYPNAHIRVLRYDDDDRGTGSTMSLVEDLRIDGPLPQQIANAAKIIERLLPQHQRLALSGRFERTPLIPRDAWLEGLVNAVVHRSYSMMGDHIRVEIFPHRIEISSPGRFPGIVNPDLPLSITRYARNPRIARVCADMGITRELGEGIKRIFHEMQKIGLAEPIYRQTSSSVTLTLSAADAVPPDLLASLPPSAVKVLRALRIAGQPLGTGQVAEFADIARPTAARALRALAAADLVVWEGTSDKDPRASWRLL